MQLPTALICLLLCSLDVVSGQRRHLPRQNQTEEAVCRPFGMCSPCPDDSLHEPFCQPFGNRRLLHCTPVNAAKGRPPERPPTPRPNSGNAPERGPPRPHDEDLGETPAWESCGRIVEKERADFWEFVLCNVFFAATALFVVFARSKKLAALQARTLAARIGLAAGSGGSEDP